MIIPAFRAPAQLRRCLEAVRAQEADPVRPEIFVRNNDTDNSLYTKAVNEGLRKYYYNPEVSYFLILTQDCYLKPGCLFLLQEHMKANPKAAICSPAQLNEKGETTWAGSLDCWPAGVHVTNPLSDFRGLASKTYWANGACFLLRKTALTECGLLDENMRFVCSDSDFSLTARLRGWDILMVPDAQAEHILGESGKISDPWLQDIKLQDMQYFTEKWLSGDAFRKLTYEGPHILPEHSAQYLATVKKERDALASLLPQVTPV